MGDAPVGYMPAAPAAHIRGDRDALPSRFAPVHEEAANIEQAVASLGPAPLEPAPPGPAVGAASTAALAGGTVDPTSPATAAALLRGSAGGAGCHNDDDDDGASSPSNIEPGISALYAGLFSSLMAAPQD